MELIYRAWDGTEFDERSACEKYEENNPCVMMMYDSEGKTSNANDAYVVNLKDNGDTKNFIELCKAQGTIFDGIDKDDCGLYVWDANRAEYFYVSDIVEDALKRYFED